MSDDYVAPLSSSLESYGTAKTRRVFIYDALHLEGKEQTPATNLLDIVPAPLNAKYGAIYLGEDSATQDNSILQFYNHNNGTNKYIYAPATLYIKKDLLVEGNVTINNNLTVKGNAIIEGILNVTNSGNSVITGGKFQILTNTDKPIFLVDTVDKKILFGDNEAGEAPTAPEGDMQSAENMYSLNWIAHSLYKSATSSLSEDSQTGTISMVVAGAEDLV